MSLDWPEYLVAAACLALSIWLGVKSRNANNCSYEDYIKNNVPLSSIIVSLIAAETSGVSMLGKPAEAYVHGMDFYYLYALAGLGCLVVCIYVFVPILTNLDTPTLYDYFELRFDASVRRLTTVTFIILKVDNIRMSMRCRSQPHRDPFWFQIFYTGTCVIPPAVVIAQFSGVNIDYVTIGLCSITIFYTTLGGLKGVVWTDVLQGIVMFISMAILTAISVGQVGGISRIMTLAYATGRTQFPNMFTADVSERYSIWVGFSFLHSLSPVALNHSNYQRIKSLSAQKTKLTLLLLICGMVLMSLGATFTGLAIYAYYYGCDPKMNKLIPNYSNLVVYWLNDVGNRIVGLRGVYIAGITCASISSMSTHMNSSADLMCSEITKKWKNLDRTVCMSCLTIIVGVLGSLFALYFKSSSSLVELNHSVVGIEGIISSLFIMGAILVPVTATGALTGGVSSLLFTLFVSLGSRIFLAGYKLQYNTKYMSTDSCSNNSTIGVMAQVSLKSSKPFSLFIISPFCVGPLAVLISIVVGLVVSLMFPDKTPKTNGDDPNLYAPFVRSWVASANKRKMTHQHQDHLEETHSLRIQNEQDAKN